MKSTWSAVRCYLWAVVHKAILANQARIVLLKIFPWRQEEWQGLAKRRDTFLDDGGSTGRQCGDEISCLIQEVESGSTFGGGEWWQR